MGQTDGTTSPTDVETGEPTPAPSSSVVDRADKTNPNEPIASAPMARTLLTGASLQSTWRMPGLSDNSSPPDAPAAARETLEGIDASGVHSLPPQAQAEASENAPSASDAPAAASEPEPPALAPTTDAEHSLALADTQKTTALAVVPKTAPASDAKPAVAEVEPSSTPRRRGPTNRNLGRTLRMELKIARDFISGDAPSSTPPSAATSSNPPRAASWDQRVVSGATQRIGTSHETGVSNERAPSRATDPFGHMAKNRLNPRNAFGPRSDAPPPLPSPPRPAVVDGSSFGPSATSQPALPPWAARSLAPNHGASRRPPRVGDRTVITRRGVSKRDWLFMGLLVAALGVTASMLLSYQSQNQVDGPAADATNVEHAVNAAADGPAAQADGVLPANVTEIVSNPPSAEVVFGGAVIGNTPVRVARANFDADYLVRLAGHDPQLVRVNANSPATIVISLKPAQ